MNKVSPLSLTKKGILFLSWLLFSPLFFILATIWKSPKIVWRCIITLFSPLSLITILILVILGVESYDNSSSFVKQNTRSSYYDSEIETQMKMRINIPGYKETLRHKYEGMGPDEQVDVEFAYDYSKRKVFFSKLKSLAIKEPEHWKSDKKSFKYHNWDLPGDGNFDITIFKDSGKGKFSFGTH